jgi:hypothetical protein
MLRCVRMSQMRYDPHGVLNFTGSAMNLSLERIGAIFHEAAVPIEIVNPFQLRVGRMLRHSPAREHSK